MKSAEAGAREILGEMSNKEYLARRAIVGTMPRLNRVFEEFGIHHEEHDVPVKVHKSLEDKAKRATTKNATAAAKAKKRKGTSTSKIISKRQKTTGTFAATSATASVEADEEVVENAGGGLASVDVGMDGEHSTASLDLGGDDFVDTALQGMGGGPTAEPSVVVPMPSILGDDSSGTEGEGIGSGNASSSREGEAASVDRHHPAAGVVEVSEDEVGASSLAAPF